MANIKKISELDTTDDNKLNQFVTTDTDGNVGLTNAQTFVTALTQYVDEKNESIYNELSEAIENKAATIEPIILTLKNTGEIGDYVYDQSDAATDLGYGTSVTPFSQAQIIFQSFVSGVPVLVKPTNGYCYKVLSMHIVSGKSLYSYVTYSCDIIYDNTIRTFKIYTTEYSDYLDSLDTDNE